MSFILGMLIGCILTILFTYIFILSKCDGVLRVDQSDPFENPYLFLELKKNFGHIAAKKFVIFEVVLNDFVSHK